MIFDWCKDGVAEVVGEEVEEVTLVSAGAVVDSEDGVEARRKPAYEAAKRKTRTSLGVNPAKAAPSWISECRCGTEYS